jgi:hypothetical protein
MTQTLATFGLAEVATGVMPGLDQDKVPLWVEANNVICDQFGVRPSPGYGTFDILNGLFDSQPGNFDSTSGLFDSKSTGYNVTVNISKEIRGLIQTRTIGGQRQIYYGTLEKLYINTGVESDITNTNGNYNGYADEVPNRPATYWSMTPWGDWIIATNGVDVPQIYKNGVAFTDIANVLCTRAELAFVMGPHLVLANTSNGINTIEWSAQDDPEAWDFNVHVTAGRRTIRTFEGPIIAAVPLGRAYLLYGETQAHIMQYGGQFTFSTVPGPKGCGAVSKNSVVAVGAMNYGLMPEGIFATDGVTVQWITYPQLGRWLVDNVDWNQKSKIAAWYDPENRCIRWVVPTNTGQNQRRVLVFNLVSNAALTFEDQIFTVGSERGAIGHSLIGTINGNVLAQRWDVAKPNRILETKYIDLGSKDRRKYVDAVRIMTTGSKFSVYIGFAENVSQRVDWEYLGVVGELTENMFYCMRDTVYVKFKIECNDPNANWQLAGIEILGRPTGRRY